jgi:uncharacterized protein YecE (DUF72 family)
MKFGSVNDPSSIEMAVPGSASHFKSERPDGLNAFVGLSKWNKADIKGFYPKDAADELAYYSTQFNSVELNATFFRLFPASQFEKWREQTAPGFIFFPKLTQDISHLRRLRDFEPLVDEFVSNVSHLKEKLGVVFLQTHDNFAPTFTAQKTGELGHCLGGFSRVELFIKYWRKVCNIPLAIETRQTDWHNDPAVSQKYYKLLEDYDVANIITDTAGRRDQMHMHLTTKTAFIRFVGCNIDEIDYKRLDGWARRITEWKDQGLAEVYFFVHQHKERDSAKLAKFFIERLNETAGVSLEPPTLLNQPAPTMKP